MTSDIKTVHIYDTKSSEYLANISKEHPHNTLKYFAENLPKKSNVLDYGCGPGLAAEYLANLGHNVTAFDASQNMIELVLNMLKLGVIRRHLILSQKMKYLMVSGPVFHFFMQKGKIYHVYLPY